MRCETCSDVLPEGTQSCPDCGSVFECSDCGLLADASMFFCRRCGSTVMAIPVEPPHSVEDGGNPEFVCTQCGEEADQTMQFCRLCGAPVQRVEHPTEELPHACSSCGFLLPQNAVFCPGCGTSAQRADSPATDPLCDQCAEPLLPDTRFCVACGAPVEHGSGPANQNSGLELPKASGSGGPLGVRASDNTSDQPLYTVGAAFNYGWLKLQKNLGGIALGGLAYLGGLLLLWLLGAALLGLSFSSAASSVDPYTGQISNGGAALGGLGLFGFLLILIGFWLATFIFQAGLVRGGMCIVAGEPVRPATIFTAKRLPEIVLASLIVAVATSVGFALCFIPGLIVSFFSQFFLWFLIADDKGPIAAITASFRFVNQRLGTLVGFAIATWITLVLGSLALGVGLLVAIPVVVIAQAFTFMRLQDLPVAE